MTGYPWATGDQLFAADLNAAIAQSAPPVGTHYLPTSGAIPMTGPLTLAGNATLPLHAVPLQQVNAAIPVASSTLPLMDGTASAGSAIGWSRGDHVHATDTSRYAASNPSNYQTAAQVTSAIAAGGTVTGPLMVTATGGNTSRSVQDQFGDLADVKDFGAKGDGTTDDTAAFNAAIATGKNVLVTSGTYIVQPITISQSMVGMGMGSSILRAAVSFPAGTGLVTQNAVADATMRDLTLDGRNLATYGVVANQSLTQQTGLRFERLEITNIGSSSSTVSPLPGGIFWYVDTARPTSKQAIVITDCYVHDIYGDGIHADGTGNVISNNTVINIGSAGIAYDLAVDGVVSGNTINNVGTLPVMAADGITGYGQNNLRNLIIGNMIDTGQNHGIHIGGNNSQIVGNKVYNVQAYGILLQSAPNASPTPSVNGIIANNEVDTAAGGGIRCGWFSRVTVSGNTVSNLPPTAGPALVFLISSDCVCSNNIVYNIGNDGVLGNTALNLIVSGNRISTVTGMGVHDAGGSTGMRVSDNIITGESTVSNWDRMLVPQGSGSVIATGPLIANNSVVLNNATSNLISYNTAGIGAPTFTTRSAGTKIVIYPQVSSTSVDNAIGLAGNNFWSSIPNNAISNTFSWYGGTTQVAYLDGVGNFYAANNMWCPGGFTVTASGTYPFQAVVASGNQQLQFQGPNYAITCNGATGNLSFLVGSATPVATVTPTGISVTGTLTSNGALTVSAGGITVQAGGMNITNAATFNNNVNIAGVTTFGTNTTSATEYLQGPASSNRDIHWQTAGVDRWVLSTINTETGTGNAGADLRFESYTDAGGAVWPALTLTRATGMVTCGNNLTVGGPTITMGATSGQTSITQNGGGGAFRGIFVQTASTTIFSYGATNTSDWGLNRYVAGTATDFPIMVRSATGQLEIASSGTADILIGKQTAKTLTDTGGYMIIPWCQGTPTGVPANASKGPCVVFDVTGFKLWVYTGSAWKGVVVA